MLQTILTIAGVFVLAVVLYFWRGNRAYNAFIQSFSDGVNTMRAMAGNSPSYRRLVPGDRVSEEILQSIEILWREYESIGFYSLGDFFESHAGVQSPSPVRWFVDSSREICGWIGVATPTTGGLIPAGCLFSESNDGHFFVTTVGTSAPSLVRPSHIVREYVSGEDGIKVALMRHRNNIGKQAANGATLSRVATIDDAFALMRGLSNSNAKWRREQDSEQLLEWDLRAVLGARYEEFAEDIKRHMQQQAA